MIKRLDARRAVDILLHGPESQRLEVNQRLNEKTIDRDYLRQLIKKELEGDYATGKELEAGDDYIYWVRSWLVNTLAQLKDNDQATRQLVNKYVDHTVESQRWVRYWALEGLYIANAPDLTETAQRTAASDPEPLVKKLGEAILAGRGDVAARNAIVDALTKGDDSQKWAVLRALRVVWIPAAAPHLMEILQEDWGSNLAYDAIIATWKVPEGFGRRQEIASIVASQVWKYRNSPVHDGTRIRALRGLGQLKDESTSHRLLECLTDDNPAIVRESILALRDVLGFSTAVARLVEEAAERGEDQVESFARALRWLDRKAVVDELDHLQETSDQDKQELVRRLLGDVGGVIAYQKLNLRSNVMETYNNVLSKSQNLIDDTFEKSIRNANQGFRITQFMDVTVFVVGLLLICVAIYILLGQPTLLSTLGGTALAAGSGILGALGIIYATWIAKPREKVREAVKDLMEMRVVFQTFLRQIHQIDQAYTRRLIEEEPILAREVGAFTALLDQHMKSALGELDRAVALAKDAQVEGRAQSTPSTAPGGSTAIEDDDDQDDLDPSAKSITSRQ